MPGAGSSAPQIEEAARRAHRGRRMARARGAGEERAARPRRQGRCAGRGCDPDAAVEGGARRTAGAARGFAGSRNGEAILKGDKGGACRRSASLPPLEARREMMPENAQAAAEVLKLALKIVLRAPLASPPSSSPTRPTSRRSPSMMKPTWPLLHGWRRELFGISPSPSSTATP